VVSGLRAVANSATTATVSFTDTNTGTSSRMYLVERSDNGTAYRVIASIGTSTSVQDVGLTPGATYSYRVRGASWSAGTSDYSAAASVTMPALAAGAPVTPSGLQATSLSATSVQVTWTNNDPSNPQFKIERANFNAWGAQTWTQIAVTAPGATSFTDTGRTPESPYAYRVRATNAAGDSDYATPADDVQGSIFDTFVTAITASAGTGTPKTYNIGPGQTYTSIGALDWSKLGPGDTVNIYYKPGGYHEIFQVAVRGTPASWITINGVPDPATGALPIIDGTNAVLAPQFQNHYAPLSGAGAVVFGTKPNYTAGYKPGYVTLQNLEIKNAYSANTFTDFDGSVKHYGGVGAGVYLERADHITLKRDVIHDNGEGVFGAGQSSFDRLMTNITLDSNYIYGNGNLNSYSEHNTYLEGIDTVYQFNHYGPVRDGSWGAGLKDRSVGTIIRYNYIEGGGHQLQLPEAQNQGDLAVTLPRYHTMMVYGNTLIAPPWDAASPIFYGGDQGLTPFNRKGTLYLFNNTIVVRSTQSQAFKINLVELSSTGESLDARNNIFAAVPETAGATPSAIGLLGAENYAYYGRNWINSGYFYTTSGSFTFYGNAAGTSNFITGSSAGPGFVSPANGDYHLTSGSVAINASTRLAGTESPYSLDWQYMAPNTGTPRTVVGSATDLGAFEYGI
jgi:hypothetical protein